MARLNEHPVSSDSIETLCKKYLRQNRDLAKSNNLRSMRIRELESECAYMLSENLELRGRIIELERQLQDNDPRRIADHALAIKMKLEAQLTEWGTLLAGLGHEPPAKRHSPRVKKSIKSCISFSASRPSPSQRRLRDVAREIEELGHIPENKSYSRKSMNHEQILALRSEADTADAMDSPELGPPPKSQFIDQDIAKADSPSRKTHAESPKRATESLFSPPSHKANEAVPLPEKTNEPGLPLNLHRQVDESSANQPRKAGSKRKFAAWSDAEIEPSQQVSDESQLPSVLPEKPTRGKASSRPLKEMPIVRKEARGKQGALRTARKPLSAKSTNDDLGSPTKVSKSATTDEVAAAKADLLKSKASQERSRPKAKSNAPVKIEAVSYPVLPTPPTAELTAHIAESAPLSPSSPIAEPANGDHRGDTPPPLDISSMGETSRPSRRNRAAVSYVEPNLRDKMRRPTKELYDAVAGERKYAQRSGQAEQLDRVKRESDVPESWKMMPSAPAQPGHAEPESTPASPLAPRRLCPQALPDSVATERRRRPSSAGSKASQDVARDVDASLSACAAAEGNADTSASSSVDIYEFTSSSPQVDKEEEEEAVETKRSSRRQTTSARRLSSVTESDRSRASSRRRSMAV